MYLYELTGQYLKLLEMALDESVDPQVVQDTIEGMDGEVEEKADAYAKIMLELSAERGKLNAEGKRLNMREKIAENKEERLKRNLKNTMILTGKTKFKTDLFSFSIQKNPASVDILIFEDIPAEFLKEPVPPEPDKKKIKEYLKENNVTWAKLSQSESLRIK